MSKAEITTVDTTRVSCDGGNNDLGHPRVFLTLQKGEVDCPYCGRRFVLSASAHVQAEH